MTRRDRPARPAALILAALLGCAAPHAGTSPRRVVMGVSRLRISLPVFYAAEHGLFSKHGLDVELRRFDTAQPLADELAAGRIDAGGYVALPILFGMKGPTPHLRIATAIVEDPTHPISYLLVKKGSALHGVEALAGKRIGILPTVAYRRWIDSILRHHHVDPAGVTILPVAPPLEVNALAGGGVDALFTGDPMATAALAGGVAQPATDGPEVPRALGDPFLFGTFALSEAFATERPAQARELVAALDEAIDAIAADPAAGRAAMAPFVRAAERPFVADYPDARYLRSGQVQPAQLDRALALTGSRLRAGDVRAP